MSSVNALKSYLMQRAPYVRGSLMEIAASPRECFSGIVSWIDDRRSSPVGEVVVNM
jgi:hypothetical protein